MSTKHLLDLEILPILKWYPDMRLTHESLPLIRQEGEKAIGLIDDADWGASREEIFIPGLNAGDSDIRCLVYSPRAEHSQTGVYLHFHGGGYILGGPEISDISNIELCTDLGIVVVSVDYRLAPEHPFPAALDDGYAALSWIHKNADQLDIDSQRIAVGGDSAGGGIAASLVLRAHAEGEFPICFQSLTYPMLDDRTGSAEHPGDPVVGEFVWTRQNNQFGWSCYLNGVSPDVPYQVPARTEDLEGLPPTWICTGALDLFRDENIEYAQRLMSAGVTTELIVYPGACHAFQAARKARISKKFFRDQAEALKTALKPEPS